MMVVKLARMAVLLLGLAGFTPVSAAVAQEVVPDDDPKLRAIVVLEASAGLDTLGLLESVQSEAPAVVLAPVRIFERSPVVVVEATLSDLDTLETLPGVVSVTPDRLLEPHLEDSVPHIGGEEYPANAALGAGWSVAVIDSGTDVGHAALAGAVVVEACFATNAAGTGGACPNGSTVHIGTGAAEPLAGSSHGTHVAGIATARAVGGPRGVAPEAGLVAIKASHLEPSGDELFWESDLLAALDWIAANAATYGIAAVNMSLGGNPSAGNCDAANPSWPPVVGAVVAAGATVVASSGNEFSSTGVSAPACLSDTVAVGALTSNFTAVAAYSNSGSMLDVVAPGTSINSTDEGGGYVVATGTSMAAPHVAGAVAALLSAAPCLTPAQVRDALDQGGQIVDSRNGISRPELDLTAAVSHALATSGCGSVELGTRLAGDFNGDGDDDAAVFVDGSWEVSLSNGSSFNNPTTWASFSTKTGWSAHVTGDFNDDGRDDIANFNEGNGTWWVSISSGSSFSTSLWADFSTASGWSRQLAGDFNGDDRTDIANYFPGNGTWWVSVSSGSGFTTSLWADFSSVSGWVSQVVGDFNGDGRDDIANFNDGNGTWWVSKSNGADFTTKLWADYATSTGWVAQQAADFTGDGRDDIANYFPGNGTWWISASNGAKFTTTKWSDYSTNSGWVNQLAADYTGDGKADIANYYPGNDTWWVGPSTGSSFGISLWASGEGTESLQVVVADVDNDGSADLAGFDVASGSWRAGLSTGSSFAWTP